MPYVGQDPFNNASREALTKRAQQMQSVRRGETAIPQDRTAGFAANQLRAAKANNIKSGNYFPNNVVEKLMNTNKRNMERWSASQQRINGQ